MTLHEKILQLIEQALTPDETILPQEVLDQVTNIILRADELSAAASEIFGDTGSGFISGVKLLFGQLPATAKLTDVFPKATNLVALLNLANQLDPDKLVEDIPAEFGSFSILETPLEAFDRSGDRLQLFVYEHPTDFTESAAFLDFSNGVELAANLANFSHKMLACVTILAGLEASDLNSKRWIVSTVAEEKPRLFYCKYHILLAGHLLTNPVSAPDTSALQGIAETLRSAAEYIQYSEPFEILGGRSTVV